MQVMLQGLPVMDPRQSLRWGEQAMGHPCTWGQGPTWVKLMASGLLLLTVG